jgi:carboxypeptidase family protein
MAAPWPANRPSALCFALLLAFSCAPAWAAELVGRVVDAMDAKVFAGAVVQVRSSGPGLRTAKTDTHGFFRMPGLTPGAYILDVNLPDGRDFVARLVLLPNRKTQFLELDYSRIVPPEDDEQY